LLFFDVGIGACCQEGEAAGNNVVIFRFANAFTEPFRNRHYIESAQITIAENFGVGGRGAFHDQADAMGDVIQNHLFQILRNLGASQLYLSEDVAAEQNDA
jgi:glucose-6-phosphate 1-dehydrogenase